MRFGVEIEQDDRSKEAVQEKIRQHKAILIPTEDGFNDAKKWLFKNYDVEECTKSELYKRHDEIFWMIFETNCRGELGKMQRPKISAYYLKRNSATKNYYASSDCENIYIFFESKTERIYCECYELQKKLQCIQGVTSYDIENNTPKLIDFILRLLIFPDEIYEDCDS